MYLAIIIFFKNLDFVLLSYRTECPFHTSKSDEGLGWGLGRGRGLNPS